MFFDNEKYFEFVRRAREMGINIPIIPGIKPIHRMSQINILPKTFNTDLPGELTAELLRCKSDADAAVVGYEWCVKQCRELMERGVPNLHFYTINAADSVYKTLAAIF
jgi:methylenetetrahydrofolate reductase (NADPH)